MLSLQHLKGIFGRFKDGFLHGLQQNINTLTLYYVYRHVSPQMTVL